LKTANQSPIAMQAGQIDEGWLFDLATRSKLDASPG
jgi:hypothetical protein